MSKICRPSSWSLFGALLQVGSGFAMKFRYVICRYLFIPAKKKKTSLKIAPFVTITEKQEAFFCEFFADSKSMEKNQKDAHFQDQRFRSVSAQSSETQTNESLRRRARHCLRNCDCLVFTNSIFFKKISVVFQKKHKRPFRDTYLYVCVCVCVYIQYRYAHMYVSTYIIYVYD